MPKSIPGTSTHPQVQVNNEKLKRAALWYAARGWPVIPLHSVRDGRCSCGRACSSPGKHPRTLHGAKDASTDEAQIERWWTRWPDANIGICTGVGSGIVALDVDPRHGGAESLADLEQEYGELPATVESLTGGGGRHLGFKHPGGTVRNRSNIRPGVDLRGDGGHLVAPPSVHANGRQYCWREGHGPHELAPAEMPAWLLALVTRGNLEDAGEVAPPGTELPMPERTVRALAAMRGLRVDDQKDGSRRLYAAASIAVRFDLDTNGALATIREYLSGAPTPREYSDADILKRLHDAERTCTRGEALNNGQARRAAAPGTATLSAPPPDELPPLFRPDIVARMYREVNARLIFWRGEFYQYGETCYQALSEDELTARLVIFITEVDWWTRPARRHERTAAFPHPDHNDLLVVLVKVVPKTADIREILLHLMTNYLSDAADAPVWLSGSAKPPAPAAELLGCANGLLHLPTGRLHPHDEELFALNALDYPCEPRAPAPSAWLKFLHDLFEDDRESVETLQELFGYFLLPDTRQQKIALLIGPKRSGKGTIGRVLTGLLGRANTCAPTLDSLGTNFGLWPLLNKPLAIISDARLGSRTNQAAIVERLLSISGEDAITVDRKFLSPWTGRLPTRFLILTNELPKLADASGALASRIVLLCLKRSFYGREDVTLTDKLLAERPGILSWAIQGWRRLNERGYFVQPRAAMEALRQLEDLTSPIGEFLRERCVVEPGRSVEVDRLYAAWRAWCEEAGRAHAGTIQTFGRDLRAAVPDLRTSRPRAEGGRTRFYEGLALVEDEQRPAVELALPARTADVAAWPAVDARALPADIAELVRERDGWTPAAWREWLLHLADACAALHPDRAALLRRAAGELAARAGRSAVVRSGPRISQLL
jgi:putative DNA primase/helicase